MNYNKILSFLLICVVFFPSVSHSQSHPKIQGVAIQLQEIASDGTFDLFPENRFCKVDANSMLKLDFHVPSPPDQVQFTPEWQSLVSILDTLNSLSRQYKILTDRGRMLMLTNAPHDTTFTKQVDYVMAGAVRLLRLFVNPPAGQPLLSQPQLNALMVERHEEPYTALMEVLTARQKMLHEEAVRFAEDADKYEVLVRVFRIPIGGQRQALHVEGYDNLPRGDFRPANPLAILPSQEEFKRISVELEAAKHVSAAFNEIQKNGLAIKENITHLINDFNVAAKNLEQKLQADIFDQIPKTWDDLTSDTFLTQISALEIPESNAPNVLQAELREIRKDVDELKKVAALFTKIKESSSKLSLSSGVSFSAMKSIFKDISSMGKKVQHSFKRSKQWKERLNNVASALPVVTAHITDAGMKENLEAINTDVIAALEDGQTRIEAEFPKVTNAFSVLQDISKNPQIADLGGSMATAGAEAPKYIPQPLKDLKPAELDLRYAGIVVGDHISVTVDIQPVKSDTSESQFNPPAVVYEMETTFAGWHRKYRSSIIFSKTSKGPLSDGFQSNFALALEWHHYDRFSPNSFLNKLDFAFGLHAAFLEHDANENFEMGGGVNISVLQGLIRAGYGYNMSVKENNDYWFVGFGLFAMLGQIRDLGSEIAGK